VSPWVSVFSLPGVAENGLREQMHEAAEGVGDAAFNELHLEEFFPRVGP
jgi:hypothetical protein